MLAPQDLQDHHHLLENWSSWAFLRGKKDQRVKQGLKVYQAQLDPQDFQDSELLEKREKRESLVCQDPGVLLVQKDSKVLQENRARRGHQVSLG